MFEIEQKIINMTFDEFKYWTLPYGWKIISIVGEEKATPVSATPGVGNQKYIGMCVIIEKETTKPPW